MLGTAMNMQDDLFADRVIETPDKVATAIRFLMDRSVQNVLVVHGRDSYVKSGADKFFAPLRQSFNCFEFTQFTPNPTLEEGVSGSEAFSKNNCDAILAVGGGSTLDVAKLINVFQAHRGNELALATGKTKPDKPLAPFIAAPTTSGSGSEATHFAVVYVGKEKFSLASHSMLPDRIILEGEFTDGLAGKAFWIPVFDLICQAIESFWSVGANDLSRSYAKSALGIAWPILTRTDTVTSDDRSQLLLASHLAGRAINITKTTAPHALSYTLTTNYNIPHGNAVALFLGSFFDLHARLSNLTHAAPAQSVDLMRRTSELLQIMDGIEVDNFSENWKQLMKKRQLVSDLSEAGIRTKVAINELIDGVNVERLGNHPIALTRDDLYWHLHLMCGLNS